MATHRCSYQGCLNTSKNRTMFMLPKKESKRKRLWIRNCGFDMSADLSKQGPKYICVDHFDKDDVRNLWSGGRRILKTAIPKPFRAGMDDVEGCSGSDVDEESVEPETSEVVSENIEDMEVIGPPVNETAADNVDTSETPAQIESGAERHSLDKFKRRMIRSVARLHTEGRAGADVWRRLGAEVGERGPALAKLWERMRLLTIKKLKRLVAAGDRSELVAGVARMTATDWLLVDLVLVHEPVDLIDREHISSPTGPAVLMKLVSLVRLFRLEELRGDELARAWSRATLYYNSKGHQVSPMLLQRRWFQLKELTRSTFYSFWYQYRGNTRLLHLAKDHAPSPIEIVVATTFPNVITEAFLSWFECIEKDKVILPEQMEEKALSVSLPADSSLPDVEIIEQHIETITVDNDSDDETNDNQDTEDDDVTEPPPVRVKTEPIDVVENDLQYSVEENAGNNDFEKEIERLENAEKEISNTTLDDDTNEELQTETEPGIDKNINIDECIANIIEEANEQDDEESNSNEEWNKPETVDNSILIDDDSDQNTDNVEQVKEIETTVIKLENSDILRPSDKLLSDSDIVMPVIAAVTGGHVDIEATDINSDNMSEINENISQVNDNISKTNVDLKETTKELKDNPLAIALDSSSEDDTIHTQPTSKRDDDIVCPKLDFTDDGIQFVDDGIAYVEEDDSDIEFKEEPIEEKPTVSEPVETETPRIDMKLLMYPVVYTTKLENMAAYPKSKTTVKGDIITKIVEESKPVNYEREYKEIKREDTAVEADIMSQYSDQTVSNFNETDLKFEDNCESSDEQEIEIPKRINITSHLFYKPRNKSYNPIQLCKNPDFNTRLKRLPLGFLSSIRNRIMLNECKPMTIDLCKAFESRLTNGTIYLEPSNTDVKIKEEQNTTDIPIIETQDTTVIPSAIPVQSLMEENLLSQEDLEIRTKERNKIINLPDISEVRRINQKLLTAQVPPMRVDDVNNAVMVNNVSNDVIVDKANSDVTLHDAEAKNQTTNDVAAIFDDTNDTPATTDREVTSNPANKPAKRKFNKKPYQVSWRNKPIQFHEDTDSYLTLDTIYKIVEVLKIELGTVPPNFPNVALFGPYKKMAKKKKPQAVEPEPDKGEKPLENTPVANVPQDDEVVEVVPEDNEPATSCKEVDTMPEEMPKTETTLSNTTAARAKKRRKYCCWAKCRLLILNDEIKRARMGHACGKICQCCCRRELAQELIDKPEKFARFRNKRPYKHMIQIEKLSMIRDSNSRPSNSDPIVIDDDETEEAAHTLDNYTVLKPQRKKEAALVCTIMPVEDAPSVKAPTSVDFPVAPSKPSCDVETIINLDDDDYDDPQTCDDIQQLPDEIPSHDNNSQDSEPAGSLTQNMWAKESQQSRILYKKNMPVSTMTTESKERKNMIVKTAKCTTTINPSGRIITKIPISTKETIIVEKKNPAPVAVNPDPSPIEKPKQNKKKLMFIDKNTRDSKKPLFIGKNKLLLTNVKIPLDLDGIDKAPEVVQVPNGVKIVMLPDGTLTYAVDPTICNFNLDMMPAILDALKAHISQNTTFISNPNVEIDSQTNTGVFESPIESTDTGALQSPVKSTDTGVLQSPVKSSDTGVLQSPGKSTDTGVLQSPGKSSDSEVLKSPGKSTDTGVLQSPRKSTDTGVLQSPRKSSDSGVLQSPGKSSDSRVFQSPGKSTDTGVLQSPGKSSDTGVLQSPRKSSDSGVLQSPGKSSDTGVLQSPGKSSDTGVLQSPGKSSDTGVLQSPGKRSDTGVLQSPGKRSDTGVLQSPVLSNDPGIFQSPVKHFGGIETPSNVNPNNISVPNIDSTHEEELSVASIPNIPEPAYENVKIFEDLPETINDKNDIIDPVMTTDIEPENPKETDKEEAALESSENNGENPNDNRKSLLSDLMMMSGIFEDDVPAAAVEVTIAPSPPPAPIQTILTILPQPVTTNSDLHQGQITIAPVPTIKYKEPMYNSHSAAVIPPSNLPYTEFYSVSSYAELKYAYNLNGKFFKLDIETGVMSIINVRIKKAPPGPEAKTFVQTGMIDLTDDGDDPVTPVLKEPLQIKRLSHAKELPPHVRRPNPAYERLFSGTASTFRNTYKSPYARKKSTSIPILRQSTSSPLHRRTMSRELASSSESHQRKQKLSVREGLTLKPLSMSLSQINAANVLMRNKGVIHKLRGIDQDGEPDIHSDSSDDEPLIKKVRRKDDEDNTIGLFTDCSPSPKFSDDYSEDYLDDSIFNEEETPRCSSEMDVDEVRPTHLVLPTGCHRKLDNAEPSEEQDDCILGV